MWNAARRDFRSKHRPIQSSGVRAHLASAPSLSVLSLQTIGCNSQHLKIPPSLALTITDLMIIGNRFCRSTRDFFSAVPTTLCSSVENIIMRGRGLGSKIGSGGRFFPRGTKCCLYSSELPKWSCFIAPNCASQAEREETQSRGNHTQWDTRRSRRKPFRSRTGDFHHDPAHLHELKTENLPQALGDVCRLAYFAPLYASSFVRRYHSACSVSK